MRRTVRHLPPSGNVWHHCCCCRQRRPATLLLPGDVWHRCFCRDDWHCCCCRGRLPPVLLLGTSDTCFCCRQDYLTPVSAVARIIWHRCCRGRLALLLLPGTSGTAVAARDVWHRCCCRGRLTQAFAAARNVWYRRWWDGWYHHGQKAATMFSLL